MIKGIAKYDSLKSVVRYCAPLCLCIIVLIHTCNQTVVFTDGVRTIGQSMVLAAIACLNLCSYIPPSHTIALAELSAAFKSACRLVGAAGFFFEFLVFSS